MYIFHRYRLLVGQRDNHIVDSLRGRKEQRDLLPARTTVPPRAARPAYPVGPQEIYRDRQS